MVNRQVGMAAEYLKVQSKSVSYMLRRIYQERTCIVSHHFLEGYASVVSILCNETDDLLSNRYFIDVD
jgi:hypothetical protein